jgi:glyoxylase-like metal-dependent hydrolase (beta-lactamase superfamily II)
VVATPGHTEEHASLLVETATGLVAVAGDLFWWAADEKQETSNLPKLIARKDPFMNDFAALKKSRKMLLDLADWLIPGHGQMFRL